MKKVLLSLSVIIVLASCSTEEKPKSVVIKDKDGSLYRAKVAPCVQDNLHATDTGRTIGLVKCFATGDEWVYNGNFDAVSSYTVEKNLIFNREMTSGEIVKVEY